MNTAPSSACHTCILGSASQPIHCPFREIKRAEQTVLIEQDELPEKVWFVKNGLVALSSTDAAGNELGCSVRGPGSLLGLELLMGATSPYRAITLTESVLCGIDGSALLSWAGDLDNPPGALMRLAVGEASRRTAEQIALGGSATARVARYLLQRCRVLPHDQRLIVSQRVLARMLAMTPETLSRTLARLRDNGAISGTRPVKVSDIEKLRELAGE